MTQTLLQRIPPGSRVAIIRLRSLGDCVLTTPAISLLKQARPDLKIAVVVESRFEAVFAGNPGIAAILEPSAAAVARWKPDAAINLHGGSTSSQLTFASRARWRVGFEHFRFRALYNVRIPRAQQILSVERKVHTAEHLASAMFFLGVPIADIPRASLYTSTNSTEPRCYAVIHPMASMPEKTWAPDNFRAVAAYLEATGVEPIFIAGPGESLDAFHGFRCVLGATLDQIKGLLSAASLFVGNDSGPAHMAAAFGVPVVVLFGPSDPVIWAPWKTESRVIARPENIQSIPVDCVIAAANALTATRAGA